MELILQLFLSFAKVGLFCIGGGYASLPLIQEEVVTRFAWMSMNEFVDIFTISQMTPGPIGINAATFVGSKVAGIPGSVAATAGFVFPSVVIVLLLGYLYGIKSEVKLAEAVNENIAFKWFLRLRLTEKGPDHATISANRVRRFRDNDIAEQIFFGFVHSQWQTGDCFRDNPDTSVDRGKLNRSACVDRLSRAACAEVEGWRGTDAVLGLIPRTEQPSKRILHAVSSIKRRTLRLPGRPSVYFSTIPLYMMFSRESSHKLDNLRWRVSLRCGIMTKALEAVNLEFPPLKLSFHIMKYSCKTK